MLIGLFALPELIKLVVFRASPIMDAAKLGDQRVSFSEFKGSIKSITRGSIIGVVLGAIPGIGPSAAAFFSYGEAQRSSKKMVRISARVNWRVSPLQNRPTTVLVAPL